MADIIQYYAPERQKNVFFVDIDVPVFQKGTFGFVAQPKDEARLKLCPIFQSILNQTTPLYDREAYALREMEMKPLPAEVGTGTRLKMTSQYALNEEQQTQIYYAIEDHIKSSVLIFDEEKFIAETKAQYKDFQVDESIKTKYPAIYAMQVALFNSLQNILPRVRDDQGDIQVLNIIPGQEKGFTVDIATFGSCKGCAVGSTSTIKKLYDDIADFLDRPELVTFFASVGIPNSRININNINVYEESSLNEISYSINKEGIFNQRGKVFSFKAAP